MAVMNITYQIREIIFDKGKQQIICMNRQQYAGFMKRKGLKKTIISNKILFTFTITTKNYLT